ncbi:MAG TPA: hypothetical protein ENN80_11980 [Candidatus Hydrogenedentes bacterium]|nr:hypothetical protein [Candidatus Hydrogenedentota bacterium]
MLGRTIKMAFWATYDHIGKLMLANLLCALAIFIPGAAAVSALLSYNVIVLGAGLALLVATAICILPAALGGLAYMCKEIIDTRDGAIGDLFTGVRLFWRSAVRLGLLYGAAACCLGTSAWFYIAMLRDEMAWLGFALSALALWCLLFVHLVAMLVFPALIQKRCGVLAACKLSAALILDNPLYAVGLALQFLALAGISIAMAPLLFLLSGAAAAMLASAAYEQLARKYALIEARQSDEAIGEEGRPLEGFAGGVRVISKNGVLVVDDQQDDYLNRGLQDFLFPWKG